MDRNRNLAVPPSHAEQLLAQSEGDHDYVENLTKQLRGWSAGDQSSDDARRMVWLMAKAADELELLERNLVCRDQFIGDKGLFEEFLASLPERI